MWRHHARDGTTHGDPVRKRGCSTRGDPVRKCGNRTAKKQGPLYEDAAASFSKITLHIAGIFRRIGANPTFYGVLSLRLF